jgi:integrin beta 3
MLDVDALSEMMAGIISDEVGKALAPLQARIAELEARKLETGPPGEKGDPGDPGKDGRDGIDGNNGSDGRGVKELLIDREGNLIASMDDGEMKSLGPVIGKDGDPGKDGRDGFGFDDLDVCVLDDDRTIELSFRRGEEEKAFTLKWPTVIYRGVWREGDFAAGDSVTWGGSLWIAEKDTSAKPDTPDSGWKLAVKKGRDGKPNG